MVRQGEREHGVGPVIDLIQLEDTLREAEHGCREAGMRFLKENCDSNRIVNEGLIPYKTRAAEVSELAFCFFKLQFAIGVDREPLFIVTVVGVYHT